MDKKEEVVAPCKVNFDIQTAKELLLFAKTPEEQQQWVTSLSKKVRQKGYATKKEDSGRSSPRSSMREYKMKTSSLPKRK